MRREVAGSNFVLVFFIYGWFCPKNLLSAEQLKQQSVSLWLLFIAVCLFVWGFLNSNRPLRYSPQKTNEILLGTYQFFSFLFFFPWAKNQNLLASISPSHCPFRLSWRVRLDANEWCCKSSVGLGTEMYIVFVAWWKLWNGSLTKEKSFLPSKNKHNKTDMLTNDICWTLYVIFPKGRNYFFLKFWNVQFILKGDMF